MRRESLEGRADHRVVTRLLLVGLAGFVLAWPSQGSFGAPSGPAGDPTAARYAAVRDELFAMVDSRDPKVALARVRVLITQDAVVSRSCHQLVHELGRRAFAKYADFAEAIKFHDEVCNSGYLHGVIEARFSKPGEDVFAAMRTVCRAYRPNTFLGWQCHHGVGHGLMYYTGNDLPRALTICDSYRQAFARSACFNGTFMENFNFLAQLTIERRGQPSRLSREEDPAVSCNEQEARHKEDCFLYAPTYFLALHDRDYPSALRWCLGVRPEFREVCARGVGGEMVKEHNSAPKLVEKTCIGAPPLLVEPCIQGMVDLYVMHNGAIEPAVLLCDGLEPSNRDACRTRVAHWRRIVRS
jgi:hypothetical protein